MSISSVNDWQKLGVPNAKEDAGDWLRFERPSSLQRVVAQERELESRRRSAYAEYVSLVENDQRRVPPAYKVAPLSYSEWSKHLPADVTDISLASQIATNASLLSKMRSEEAAQAEAAFEETKQAVISGSPDPGFKQLWGQPATLESLKMTEAQAREYAKQQAEKFVEENPDWPRTNNNFQTIIAYLENNGVEVPNSQIFKIAWDRLRSFGGMIEPAPEPEPQQPTDGPFELVDGYDPATGEPRQFTQREIWQMDSISFKKAFRMWTDRDGVDRRPKFSRSAYQ